MTQSRADCSVLLDASLINSLGVDKVKVEILDSSGYDNVVWDFSYTDGSIDSENYDASVFEHTISKQVESSILQFHDENGSAAEVIILSVSYLKNGAVVGSSLLSDGSADLKRLKYKVELPRGAKVTLFDDESLEAKYLSWNIPCPTSLPNMTYLQVKAANGFEKQITPSAGSQTIELYSELGRRYAVFGEIWTYSFAQTLWFADLRIQKSNSDWLDCVPAAGEGGTVITVLP